MKATLSVYFQHYEVKARRRVTLSGFLKFAHDFDIFPDLVNKGRVVKYYNLLTSLTQDHKDDLDLQLFVEMLLLCAFEIPAPSPQEQVIYLMERMMNSEGIQIVMKSRGVTSLPKKADIAALVHSIRPYDRKIAEPESPFDRMAAQSESQYL